MITVQKIVKKLCLPNPHSIKSEADREIYYTQNKSVLFMIIVNFAVLVGFSLIARRPLLPMQKFGLCMTTFIASVFACTCRSYPLVFKTLIFMTLTLYRPVSLLYCKDTFFFNCASVYLIPAYLLFLIGWKAFALQVIIQITYLFVLYKEELIVTLNSMTPEAYAERTITMVAVSMFMNSIIILVSQITLNRTRNQIFTEKVKKAGLKRQKQFFLSFSHEIRNLINTMIGSVQLSMLETLPPKVKDLLKNSEVCGELLLHLVNNILDTGKLEIGELEVNPTSNSLPDTLEKVWRICAQLIKSKSLRGEIKIPNDLPELVRIDRYRLIQVMMNLVSNSIKFTDAGKICIDVSWLEETGEITDQCFEPLPFNSEEEGIFEKDLAVSVISQSHLVFRDSDKKKIESPSKRRKKTPSKGILKIIVTDTGCGIPNEKLPSLFSKFNQLNDDPSKRKIGTGLGLFITKELVEKMDGQIRAYSEVDKGTSFIICIRSEALVDDDVEATAESCVSLPKTKRLRAMIVDDIDFNTIVLSQYFNKLDIEVAAVAKDGQEAFEKFEAYAKEGQSFDIVAMDVDMPIMDGKKAVQLIRSYEVKHNLSACFIFMASGNCDESEIAECVDSQDIGSKTKANVFLKKPVSLEDVSRVLRTRFGNKV